MRQHDWLQSVLPPKTARARGEAFRNSPNSCIHLRAKHVNTSTRRHLPLRVATTSMPRSTTRRQTISRPTLLRVVAFLNAPPFNLASDVPQRCRVPLRAVATSRLTLVNTFVAVQSRARVNRHGEPGSAAACSAKQSGSRTFYPFRTF